MNPHDVDARITKMKDGRTHLAHKAQHALDLQTGAVLAVTLQEADQGDTATVMETLIQPGENAAELIGTEAPDQKPQVHLTGVEEVVADKGYHDLLLRCMSEELIIVAQKHRADKTKEIRGVAFMMVVTFRVFFVSLCLCG